MLQVYTCELMLLYIRRASRQGEGVQLILTIMPRLLRMYQQLESLENVQYILRFSMTMPGNLHYLSRDSKPMNGSSTLRYTRGCYENAKSHLI